MKKYTTPTLTCAGLLLVTMLIRFLLEWPDFVPYFPYLLWNHVVVIVLGWYGFVIQKKRGQIYFCAPVMRLNKSVPFFISPN
jgi:hypothetical protein